MPPADIDASEHLQYCKSIGNKYYIIELYSDRNNIGDNGATAEQKHWKQHTTLSELYLKYNNIGDNGATAIAKALEINTLIGAVSV